MPITIPVIDLSAAATPNGQAVVATQIDRALHEVGFFAVTGHGVDRSLVEAMFAAVAELFALPLEAKLRAAPPDPSSARGYSYVGATAQSNAHTDTDVSDLAETFNAGPDPDPASEYYRRFAAIFPPNVWPAELPELPQVWSAYLGALEDLANRLMRLMAIALGLDEHRFDPIIDRPMASITANHYPALDREPLPGQFRGGAHTDYGSITLLATDGVPGLELLGGDGSWQPAPPVPGSFHVNAGDMLAHWTGGRWRSTWHRVVTPTGGPPYPERTSLAYFHSPNADAVIERLPGCGDGAADEPIAAGEYLQAKIARYYAARASAG